VPGRIRSDWRRLAKGKKKVAMVVSVFERRRRGVDKYLRGAGAGWGVSGEIPEDDIRMIRSIREILFRREIWDFEF